MESIKKSIKARIALLATVPVVFVALALTIIQTSKLSRSTSEKTIDELKSTAYSIRAMLNTVSDGDYSVDANGVMYAGDVDLTYLNDVFDKFTKDSGVYATVFYGDTRKATSVINEGKRAVGTKAVEAVTNSVLAGNEYVSEKTLVAGRDCVVAYVPLYSKTSGRVCGMVFTGIPNADLKKEINIAMLNSIVLASVLLLVVILLAMFEATKVAKAVKASSDVCGILAEGDFSVEDCKDGTNRPDELGIMARGVNSLKEEVGSAIRGVKDNIKVLVKNADGLERAAGDAASSMRDLSNAVEDIAEGATNQAQEVETSAGNVSEILRAVDSINENVTKTDSFTEEMKASSEQVVADFETLISDTKKSIEKLTDISEKMKHVADAVETVTMAANEINDIASQTNLLSLNASIEAARAGDAGRGFAVVAAEISALAEQSDTAAVKIREIMLKLKDETHGAVEMVSDMSS
nr:methyl-accepting chemotaxis protein [Lachnospiraceae bacterium]